MELKKDDDDDDDEVDIEHIVCSVCGQPDEEGNDILFCDRKGCYRAYHQNCLDPPHEKEIELEEDWFCWHCQCIDDCLDVIGEVLDDDHDDWQELFPEVRQVINHELVTDHVDNHGLFMKYDSKDEEDDEDYVPSDEESSQLKPKDDDDDDDHSSSIIDEHDGGEGDIEEARVEEAVQDNHEDDYDDSDNDDDDDFSEADIDEDEVKGLIKDAAEIDPHIMRVIYDDNDDGDGHATAADSDVHDGQAVYTYNKKRLRPRRNNNNNDDVSMNDKRFIVEGVADVGKMIARVVRGVIQIGSIERVRMAECLQDTAWIVKFDGDHQSFETGYEQVMKYLDVYMDYIRVNHDDDDNDDNDIRKDLKKRLVETEGNKCPAYANVMIYL